jgi:nicotinamide phosphoribosyltransferase
VVNGVERDVFKDPIEGHEKLSKRGRLALHYENGKWSTVRGSRTQEDSKDRLKPVFRDGDVVTHHVAEVRERANQFSHAIKFAAQRVE